MPHEATGAGGDAEPLVTGRIVISATTPPFSAATAHVRLEDVSYADAPAVVIAETTIPNIRHEPGSGSASAEGSVGETVVPFALHAPPGGVVIEPRNDYSVRVWVDRDGDGKIGPGDLRSDQSHRVLTRGFARTVTIPLRSR